MTGAVHESALDSGPVGVGRHDRRERPSFLQVNKESARRVFSIKLSTANYAVLKNAV